MNIWVIGRGYPTTSNGMWGSFELEQAKLLTRGGNEVSYIALTLSFFTRKDPRGLRAFEDDGVKVYVYSHFYFPGKTGVYLGRFEDKCWRTLFEQAEKESGLPDIIHVHYPSMGSSINEIEKYRKQGIKLFVTEHWSRVLINNLKNHEMARLKYYATRANCFVSVSEALQDAIRKRVDMSAPMEVIPNMVSPLFFETIEEKKNDNFKFITVGRLVPLKQFDVVIREFLKEFSGNEKVKLEIVGSGSERRNLESIAGGNPQITFSGKLSLEDTAKEIASADVLVSFSKYETFAVPVTEAWACGKPAIVSDKSGVASFVNKDNGVVVISDSPEQLGIAMRGLYKDYYCYNHNNISNFARANFNDEAIMTKLKDMYANY